MTAPDELASPALAAVADVLADGGEPDWERASAEVGQDDAGALAALRTIARLASAHRTRVAGPYRLLEPIGAGGFGEVFRAWDTRLARFVAVKLIPAPAVVEARRLARVRHPNVVTVHGVEAVGDRVAIAMELVEGRTLADLVATEGPLAVAEAVRVGLALARALAAVHAAGLVHGDVSARNVLCEGARVVVADFGLSRPIGSTLAGGGTQPYLAPERLVGGPPTVASDLWAAAALLFHLLTGRFPRDGPLTALRPGLPRSLVAAVEAALAPEPAARPRTAAEMAASLEGCLDVRAGRPPLAAMVALAVLTGVLALGPDLAPPPSSPRPPSATAPSPAAPPGSVTLGTRPDPFLPVLAELPVPSPGTREAPYTVTAVVEGGSLELRTSRPAWLYVLVEDDRQAALTLTRDRAMVVPVDALAVSVELPTTGTPVVVLCPRRLASFEALVAGKRVPAGARVVALDDEARRQLAATLGLEPAGRLAGQSRALSSVPEMVHGCWVRRPRP